MDWPGNVNRIFSPRRFPDLGLRKYDSPTFRDQNRPSAAPKKMKSKTTQSTLSTIAENENKSGFYSLSSGEEIETKGFILIGPQERRGAQNRSSLLFFGLLNERVRKIFSFLLEQLNELAPLVLYSRGLGLKTCPKEMGPKTRISG